MTGLWFSSPYAKRGMIQMSKVTSTFRKLFLVLAAVSIFLIGNAVPAFAATSLSIFRGMTASCPSGDVCLYTGPWTAPGPTGPHTNYSYYGYDNLSNVTGSHWIVNNQTGGAVAYL